MDLNEIVVFTRVVQAGSFTAAAKALGMPKSTVSRKVSDLEDRLDTRLLQRTTRKLSLTDAGRTYFEFGVRIVGEVEDAERAVGRLHETPRGLLRVTAGVNNTFLAPIVGDFLKRHPEVQIELLCTGRHVDLVEERFDVGIRAGVLPDSSLVARSLGSVSWWLVATPGYLKKHGRPKAPEDLAAHACMLFGAGSPNTRLHLEHAERQVDVAIPARLLVSDMDIAEAIAVAGGGIALLPSYRCAPELQARRLERVLREWCTPPTPIHVVYPTSRHLSPKVKAFVDHLVGRLTPPPWE